MKVIKLFEMSERRSDVLDLLNSLSKPLSLHILKLGIYNHDLGNRREWINEIATYLYTANKQTVKPKGNKLNQKIYDDTLFGAVGDCRDDAEANVYAFNIGIRYGKYNYPDFTITEETIDRCFDIANKIRQYALSILPTKNELTKTDIYNKLNSLL